MNAKYIGVQWRPTRGFVAVLYIDRKTTRSRYGFKTSDDAARAYDDMAREVFGSKAGLNFPKQNEKRTRTIDCKVCGNGIEVQKVPKYGKGLCSDLCKHEHRVQQQRDYRANNPEKIKRFNENRQKKHRENPAPGRQRRAAYIAKRLAEDDPYEFREHRRAKMLEWSTKNVEHIRTKAREKRMRESAAIQALKNIGFIKIGDI